MECAGKREIEGEVKKEWMESVKEWEDVEMKEVEVVKKEEVLNDMPVHLSKQKSIRIANKTIRCSKGGESWLIDRELKSVWF